MQARPFSQMEFSRRRKMQTAWGELVLASPEDVVLSKLEWNAISASERQVRDVQSIIQVQQASLDWNYLRTWAAELGVLQQLEAATED